MNFAGMLKRDRGLNQAFVSLEEGMEEMLVNEFGPGSSERLAEAMQAADREDEADDEALEPSAADPIEDMNSLTAYAQSSIASLSAFEGMYGEAGEHLRAISDALAKVSTVHHLTREFLGTVHAGIHRSNDIELTNARLVSDNNRLRRQAEMVKKLRSQHEALIEGTKRREAKAQQEIETLRQALAAARYDTIEAKSTIATMETDRAELMNNLAARTAEAERVSRENEILRERQVNLAADLDSAVKRNGDLQRRFDEVNAVHQSEQAQLAELRSKLAAAEGEFFRVQKLNDTLELRLTEAQDATRSVERDMDDQAARHASEVQALTNEIDVLKAKLSVASNGHTDSSAETAGLRHRLKDLEAELAIARDRIETLKAENESDRQAMLANSANVSQMNLRQASDQLTLDRQNQEIESLRDQVDTLKASIKRLSTYERFYQSVKSRQCEKAREGAAEIEQEMNEAQDVLVPLRASA